VSKKLPFVTSDIPRDLRSFLDRVRELVSGSGADRLLSANDLVGSGLATVDGSGNIKPPPAVFVGTPPPPTDVTATAAIRNIIVTWDNPAYVGHAHAEVWGSSTTSQSAAVLLGMTPGAIYVDEVGPSVTRYYWVRFVNTNDTPGPYNALVGTAATTGSDVTYTLGLLSGQITSTELATSLNNRINLIDGPATTTGTIPNQLAFLQGQLDAINAYPDYDNATTYATGDIVKYEGGLYKALSSTTGNLPTNATFWLKIGDYSSLADIVAVHSADISTLNTGLAGEVTARETLATQMRGSYSGTDLASVTSGLIFSERTARASADLGLAGSISTVAATAAGKTRIFRQPTAPSEPSVNDVWVDTRISYSQDYFSEAFAVPKFKQFQWTGTEWLDITDTDISDNFASITREQLARATADSALAQDILTLNAGVNANDLAIRAALQVEATTRANADGALSSLITTLDSQVNNATTGLPATRATLINDYSTTATVNSAIASSKTALRAYTDVSASRTFRQAAAPTKRGVDADTTLDIPLQTGDIWIDTDDLNKLYQWSGTAWVYSPDGAITGSVTTLAATLDTDYLTATDTENAIAQSATFLRAYADVQSKVFRTADAPTKRGVDPETAADIPLRSGDVWYDTNDSNKLYLWSGTAWVYSPDAVITGSVTAVDARVTTVENTRIGYCTIGGIASDDTTKAACEAAGGTWNVGIPIATAVKQVSVSDGSDSATLEQRFTAQKTNNDTLLAQYTVKLEVNGYVSGFGLASTAGDSVPTTDFIVNADKFAVAAPMFVGTTAPASPFDGQYWRNSTTGVTQRWNAKLAVPAWETRDYRLPLAVLTTPKTINGVAFAPGVYIDGANITTATIGSAQIADLAVDDGKIANLNVGKLRTGTIAVGETISSASSYAPGVPNWSITGDGLATFNNAVVRGTVYATDGQFVGEVIAQGAGGNRARMWAGNFEIYKDVPTVGATLYKALSRIEAGVGANNVVVTIPGYFSEQPKIIVSPANIKLYDHTFANQSQSLQCEALNITQTSFGSMVWQFTPKATLSLAANTGQTVINQTSGPLSAGWTSSQYTTPSNTASITPNITLTSSRGTGTAGNFFFRTVRWRVEYFNGSSFVAGPWNTTALGAAAPASVTTNATFAFPSAGTWVFRIVTEAFDSGGTFSTGTQFETATDSISRTGDVEYSAGVSGTLNYTPTYTLPSGWTLVSAQYNYVYSYAMSSEVFGSASITGSGLFLSVSSGSFLSGNFLSRSFTNNSANSLVFSVTASSGGNRGSGFARLTLHSTTGSVTRRRPLTNSTTASNSFSFNFYDFNLTAAQVLATGSLNWLAIGE